MASASGSNVDPEKIPRNKFGSGDPHTQTAADDQGAVTGSDEISSSEAAPAAVNELADDVLKQQRDFESSGGDGGGGGSGGSGGRSGGERPGGLRSAAPQGQGRSDPPKGAASASDAYGGDDM